MGQPRRILFRGVPMIEGWPEKIQAAQNVVSYTLNEKPVPRVRYGDEHENWGANEHACHDCRVLKGEFHAPGCDGEECPVCRSQLLSCDCPFDDRTEDA
jgi:hypothetical protein